MQDTRSTATKLQLTLPICVSQLTTHVTVTIYVVTTTVVTTITGRITPTTNTAKLRTILTTFTTIIVTTWFTTTAHHPKTSAIYQIRQLIYLKLSCPSHGQAGVYSKQPAYLDQVEIQPVQHLITI